MVTKENFDKLRIELSVKSKNGLDFTFSAAIVWLLMSVSGGKSLAFRRRL